jgi:hypothetical protein
MTSTHRNGRKGTYLSGRTGTYLGVRTEAYLNGRKGWYVTEQILQLLTVQNQRLTENRAPPCR